MHTSTKMTEEESQAAKSLLLMQKRAYQRQHVRKCKQKKRLQCEEDKRQLCTLREENNQLVNLIQSLIPTYQVNRFEKEPYSEEIDYRSEQTQLDFRSRRRPKASNEKERLHRKRQQNVSSSYRKYQRQKIDEMNRITEIDFLQNQNDEIHAEVLKFRCEKNLESVAVVCKDGRIALINNEAPGCSRSE